MNQDLYTENLVKFDNKYLESISKESILQYFEDWTKNIDKIKNNFLVAKPFEHIIL